MGKTVEFRAEYHYSPEYHASAYLEVKPPEPPKPPWHKRVKDRNLSLAKLLKLKEVARECGKQAVWEIGKSFLGLNCQPAKSAKA